MTDWIPRTDWIPLPERCGMREIKAAPFFTSPPERFCWEATTQPMAVSILLAPPAFYAVSESQQAPHAC